jgi:ceramide glucosyltransferase
VKEDTLLDMVSCMTPKVALVHQMPYTCDRRGFPSILEKVYFGTAHARIYLSADFLGINCPTGMSALMRKSVLDSLGGIKAFGSYLAEDYFFAKSMTDRGWRIRISSAPALQNSETPDVESFHIRISRWAKLRFAMVPHTIVLEPLSECLILGLIASWALNFLFQVDPFAVYLFHVLTWFLLDFSLLTIIQNGSLPFSKTDFVAAWSFRELTALLVFLKALWDPDIRWRTGTYRLKWGGIAEEIKPKI